MEIFQLNPNDIDEEGISVDIYDQNKRLIHGAAMKIVCRNDETDEGDIFNPRY